MNFFFNLLKADQAGVFGFISFGTLIKSFIGFLIHCFDFGFENTNTF